MSLAQENQGLVRTGAFAKNVVKSVKMMNLFSLAKSVNALNVRAAAPWKQ